MRSSVVLLGLCVAGTAWAKGASKPIVDSTHVADESSVFMTLGNQDGGFWVQVTADLMGVSNGDLVRLEVRHSGQTGSQDCVLSASKNPVLSKVDCNGARGGKIFKGAGPLEADLILHADADDKEYLLRTFKVNAKNWDGKGEWQIEPDDVLGTAYYAPYNGSGTEQPSLRFWLANEQLGDSTLRCKVDGKPLPKDIEGRGMSSNDLTADVIKPKSRTTWHWSQIQWTADYWVIKRPQSAADAYISFTDHPGTWECQLRKNGAAIRDFKFVVDAKGEVAPGPMQKAKGAPTLPDRYAQIEMKIDKDSGVDQRIKPDQIKKSRGFGMPWPQDDSVKALLASLPTAYENQNPVAVKPKGKLLDGPTANPPRFVDESTTYVSIRAANKDSYVIRAHADVAGVSQAQSNHYKLVWKQNGKELGWIGCSWGGERTQSNVQRMAKYGTDNATDVDCENKDVVFKAKGPVEAQLIMDDDTDGNQYLLRTYKVNVVKLTSFGDPVWQIVPDDVLSTAWIAGNHPGVDHIIFRFWLGVPNATELDTRCVVDGKTKVPDFKIGGGDGDHEIAAEVHAKNGDATKYVWAFQNAHPNDADTEPGLPPKSYQKNAGYVKYLGEYPGTWECDVRDHGKAIRKLIFHVNDKGFVDPNPALAGIPTTPDVVPIELRFGKDPQDFRVRPDAMKKSMQFGLPWPKGPPKDLPKASGPELK